MSSNTNLKAFMWITAPIPSFVLFPNNSEPYLSSSKAIFLANIWRIPTKFQFQIQNRTLCTVKHKSCYRVLVAFCFWVAERALVRHLGTLGL